MSVPGDNLLLDALDLIASQTVIYERFNAAAVNAAGIAVPAYDAPVTVTLGSFQAVSKERYQYLGLDLQKDYALWYVPASVVGTERDSKGDRVTYNGRLWQLESTTNWFGQDGWMQVQCVDIGAANA